MVNRNKAMSVYKVKNGKGLIPEGVSEIAAEAFDGCEALQAVIIPNSVKRIHEVAFRDCVSLKELTIPASVEEIEHSAFFCCSGLEKIIVEDGNKRYDSREKCNAIIETATNKLILGCNSTVIPTSVVEICNSAFMDCKGLEEVVIPEGVIVIEEAVFYGCEKLKRVTFPQTLTTIKGNAFYGCRSLESIVLPASVTKIEGLAFGCCGALRDVRIENSNTEVDPIAFTGTPVAEQFEKSEANLQGKRAERGRQCGWYNGKKTAKNIKNNKLALKYLCLYKNWWASHEGSQNHDSLFQRNLNKTSSSTIPLFEVTNMFRKPTKDGVNVLFVNCNPAGTDLNHYKNNNKLCHEFFYYDNTGKNQYFQSIDDFYKELGLNDDNYAMIDMFPIVIQEQAVLKKAYNADPSFFAPLISIFIQAVIELQPKVIVVTNAFVGSLFQTAIPKQINVQYNNVGVYHEIKDSRLNTAVFCGGMIAGRHQMDRESKKRLIKDVKEYLLPIL